MAQQRTLDTNSSSVQDRNNFSLGSLEPSNSKRLSSHDELVPIPHLLSLCSPLGQLSDIAEMRRPIPLPDPNRILNQVKRTRESNSWFLFWALPSAEGPGIFSHEAISYHGQAARADLQS
jgi:hypothetical protein